VRLFLDMLWSRIYKGGEGKIYQPKNGGPEMDLRYCQIKQAEILEQQIPEHERQDINGMDSETLDLYTEYLKELRYNRSYVEI